jgi:hypothetical protein
VAVSLKIIKIAFELGTTVNQKERNFDFFELLFVDFNVSINSQTGSSYGICNIK